MVMAQQAPSGSLRDNSQRNNMGDEFGSKVNQLISELRTESEVLQREGSEIELLVRQTHGEVEKLANRELTITNRVRDMELNLDNYSRTDMKTIYNSAHEVQMRLFMMRAQVEQLEAKRNNIKALQQRIARTMSVLALVPEGYAPGGSTGHKKHNSLPLSPLPETSQEMVAEKQTIAQVIQAQEN